MSRGRILVIERDARIRDLLQRLLGGKGYDVTATADGNSGMSLFISERPDLMLIDVELPDIDGTTLCKQVRETQLDVALVLMGTARQARRKIVEQTRAELGIRLFLVKPFGLAALMAAVEQGLAGDPAPEPEPESDAAPEPPVEAEPRPTPEPAEVATPAPPAPSPAVAEAAPGASAAAPDDEPPDTGTFEQVAPDEPMVMPIPAPADAPDAAAARPEPAGPALEPDLVHSAPTLVGSPVAADARFDDSTPTTELPVVERQRLDAMDDGSTDRHAVDMVEPSAVEAPPFDGPGAADGGPFDGPANDSYGGLLAGDSMEFRTDELPFEGVGEAHIEAVYPVDDQVEHRTWGVDSLQMEAIRHGVMAIAEDEKRYALQPMVPNSPSDPRGIYGAVTVPQLLYRCFRDLFTGRLVMRRGPVRKVVWLANGRPIGAESNIRSESLGYLMLQAGVIDQNQRAESVRIGRQMGIKQGEALVRIGALGRPELVEQLKEQVRRRLLNCFAWSGAEYGLTYEPDVVSRVEAQELNPLVVIFDGIKTSFPIAPLVDHFDDCNRRPVSTTDRLRDYATMLRGFADELRVTRLCDGQRTLGEVMALSPYGLVDTLRILRALEITGCVSFGDKVPVDELLARGAIPSTPRMVGGSVVGSLDGTLDGSAGSGGLRAVRARRRSDDRARATRTTGEHRAVRNAEPRTEEVRAPSASARTPSGGTERPRRSARRRPSRMETGPDLIKAETNFSKGKRCLDNEDIDNALAHFKLASRQDPHQPLFRMYLAWAQFLAAPSNDRKARAEAQQALKTAVDSDSNQDMGYVLLGNVHRANGNNDAALKLYRKALNLNRRNPHANRAIRELEGRRSGEEQRDAGGLFGKFFTRR